MARHPRTLSTPAPLTALLAALLACLLAAPPGTAYAASDLPAPDPGLVGPVELGDPGPGSSADDGIAARAGATITLRGRGNGHGHGMSQYGAKGAAERGRSYRRIISFYYPHTAWARTRGAVRVLLTADTSRDTVVGARRGLQVRAVGGSWRPLSRSGAQRWRLIEIARNRTAVDVALRGRSGWTRVRTIRGDAEVSAGGKPVRLFRSGGSARYRGILRSVTPDAGASEGRRDRDTVNVLAMEDYLRGVVPLEMPALWDEQAVRAQAVAARSYAAYERAHPPRGHYQLCDTTSCQVYGGVDAEQPGSNAAIRATRRQARFAGGEPAFTQFSASNGGWTAKGSFRYLPAKRDRNERGSGNPYAEVDPHRLEGLHRGVATGHRHPAPCPAGQPRRSRPVERSGRDRRAARHGRAHPGLRRRVPLAVRAPVDLVHEGLSGTRGDGRRAPLRRPAPPGVRRARRPGPRTPHRRRAR